MTGISRTDALPRFAPLQHQGSSQKTRIEFENALAAQRTIAPKSARDNKENPMADLPGLNALPPEQGRPVRRQAVPAQKVFESLNKLIQRPQTEATPSLDLRQ